MAGNPTVALASPRDRHGAQSPRSAPPPREIGTCGVSASTEAVCASVSGLDRGRQPRSKGGRQPRQVADWGKQPLSLKALKRLLETGTSAHG